MEGDGVLKAVLKGLGEHYTFIKLLGSGATSKVYLLHHEILNQEFAIKVMDFDYIFQTLERGGFKNSKDKKYLIMVERFINEARVIQKIVHPNVVMIYDVGIIKEEIENIDFPFIKMEFVDGITLKDFLEDNFPLQIIKVIEISKDILNALSVLHRANLVHRDLKPFNIMIEKKSGKVKLIDFGIAKDYMGEATLTTTGPILGSPAYMAPEQFSDSSKVGPKADIYSFGIILYEMLTGERPFESSNYLEIMYGHLHKDVPNVKDKNSHLPKGIENIIFKAMAKKPEDRYGSAQYLLDDLERLMEKVESPKRKGRFKKLGGIFPLGKKEKEEEILNDDISLTRGLDVKSSRLRALLKRKSEDLFKRYELLWKFVTHNFLRFMTLEFYTNHGEDHVLNVEESVYGLLTKEAKEKLSSFETFCLLCACCLHDVGMVAKTGPEESIAIVRETHHIRAKQILEKEYLKFQLNQQEAKIIGEICYGHGISNINELKISKWSLAPPYGKVNVGFLTALLRMGDSLDLSYFRATSLVVDLKKVKEASLNHWRSHNFISGKRIDHQNREIVIDVSPEITTDDYDLSEIYRLRDYIESELAIAKEVFKKNGIFLDKIFLNAPLDKKKEIDENEIRYLIENERYWDSISVITQAEDQNRADDTTRALKETVIKNLSDAESESFKKRTKEGKSINYPESGSVLGRDDEVKPVIEILDKTPIVTVYGIPGIGKSAFIHELRKSESYNNRLYKRFLVTPDMTINDLFQQLALVLGCRDMLN